MSLISKDTAIEAACGGANDWDGGQCRGRDEYIRNAIQAIPSIEAVPLDKLCKLLSDIYGAPCQLGEIEPYGGCEPDDEGNCYGMRTSNVACWKDFIKYNIGVSHD